MATFQQCPLLASSSWDVCSMEDILKYHKARLATDIDELSTSEGPVNITSFNSSSHQTADEFLWPVSGFSLFWIYTLISHILLISITWVICRRCWALNMVKTAEHAFYCTLAFVLFVGEALLMRHNFIMKLFFGILALDLVHMSFGLLAIGIGIMGVGFKTYQKRQRKIEDPTAVVMHFRTKHGFFGLLGCIFLLLAGVSGVILYGFVYTKASAICHRVFGLIAFVMLMISQIMSYNTGFARRQWKMSQIKWFKFFTLVALLTTASYEFKRLGRDIFSALSY